MAEDLNAAASVAIEGDLAALVERHGAQLQAASENQGVIDLGEAQSIQNDLGTLLTRVQDVAAAPHGGPPDELAGTPGATPTAPASGGGPSAPNGDTEA